MSRATLLFIVLAASAANAAPPLGGAMNHVNLTLAGTEVIAEIDDPSPMLLQSYAQSYAPPEDVLDSLAFNAQYGWLASGFWSLPSGASVWIEPESHELDCYAGRTFNGYSYFDPIHGTDGSSMRIEWDGSMLHNYYATDSTGRYEVGFTVFVGDDAGEPWPGFSPGFVTLVWIYPCLPADITTQGAAQGDADFGVPDGLITGADISFYVNEWLVSNTLVADLTTTGAAEGDPLFGVPDGQITGGDIQFYVNVWITGCP